MITQYLNNLLHECDSLILGATEQSRLHKSLSTFAPHLCLFIIALSLKTVFVTLAPAPHAWPQSGQGPSRLRNTCWDHKICCKVKFCFDRKGSLIKTLFVNTAQFSSVSSSWHLPVTYLIVAGLWLAEILASDWPEYWPLIGQDRSHDPPKCVAFGVRELWSCRSSLISEYILTLVLQIPYDVLCDSQAIPGLDCSCQTLDYNHKRWFWKYTQHNKH